MAAIKGIYRLVPNHLTAPSLIRHGGEALRMTELQRRWKTTTSNEPQQPTDGPTTINPTGGGVYYSPNYPKPVPSSLLPKKEYGPPIPDRIWRAPIGSQSNPLKYTVRRTLPYNTLPVYSVMKPGLGQIWTLIKKIDGDLHKFKEDLLLDFPNANPILKLHLNQVMCRGKIAKEVKLWLQDRGF